MLEGLFLRRFETPGHQGGCVGPLIRTHFQIYWSLPDFSACRMQQATSHIRLLQRMISGAKGRAAACRNDGLERSGALRIPNHGERPSETQ
jgi:hypothetical protein